MRRTLIRGAAIAPVLAIVLGIPALALQAESLNRAPQILPTQGKVPNAEPGKPAADNEPELQPDRKPNPDKGVGPDKDVGPDKGLGPEANGSNGNCHGIQHAFGRVSTNHGAAMGKGNAAAALQAVADRQGCDLSLAAASPD